MLPYSIKKEKVSKEVLEQLYIIDSKTQSEIASILNTSRATIGNYLKHYNINKKSKIEIYTDGSCHTQICIGAWASIILIGDKKINLSGVLRMPKIKLTKFTQQTKFDL